MILPGHIMAWPKDWQELWNERAGIMQYDGPMGQKQAEYAAEKDIRRIAMGCSSMAEHSAVNRAVEGSSPSVPAK